MTSIHHTPNITLVKTDFLYWSITILWLCFLFSFHCNNVQWTTQQCAPVFTCSPLHIVLSGGLFVAEGGNLAVCIRWSSSSSIIRGPMLSGRWQVGSWCWLSGSVRIVFSDCLLAFWCSSNIRYRSPSSSLQTHTHVHTWGKYPLYIKSHTAWNTQSLQATANDYVFSKLTKTCQRTLHSSLFVNHLRDMDILNELEFLCVYWTVETSLI